NSLKEAFELKVPAFVAEFSVSKIFRIKQELTEPCYQPVPKFPAFEFDFAVTVDLNILAQDLLHQIKKNAGKQLIDIQIFDVFESEVIGKGKKSIAFRLSFIDKKKTLTINEIEPIIKKILNVLENKFSAKLRS